MSIDIEKEREWWKSEGPLVGDDCRRVLRILDELEVTRSRLKQSGDWYDRYADMQNERNALRCELRDQRAHAVRLLAIRYVQERRFPLEAMIPIAAKDYDAAQVISVPLPPVFIKAVGERAEKGGDS